MRYLLSARTRLVLTAVQMLVNLPSAATLFMANLGYGAALVVASLVNRTQRQRRVPREVLGWVTSTVLVLFLAVDPLGVVTARGAQVTGQANPGWEAG